MPRSVICRPVNGCITVWLSIIPGGAITQSLRSPSRSMPTSIFRKRKPISMRCFSRCPVSRPLALGVVSQ